MRRLLTVVLITVAAGAAAGAGYLWWTAPPAADETALAAALALAPAADGRVALAQPRRAARWLLRHPQALALLAAAAPAARPALPRLQPLLASLVGKARGPLVVWWTAGDLAVATRLRPGAIRAVTVLAASRGLACESDGDVVRVATAAALLVPRQATPPPPGGTVRLAALADVGGHRWRLTAGRERLTAVSGAEIDLPDEPGLSRAETRDATPLGRMLGLPEGTVPSGARAVFGAGSGWAVAVSGARLPGFVRDVIRLPPPGGAPADAAGEPAARHWQGLLGDVWVRGDGDRLTIATSEALLAQVAPPPALEQGRVTGRDLVWLADELATALARLPLLDREARAVRAVGAQVAGLGAARWRVSEKGARIELEW